jgi:hypothetical protein
MATKRDERLPGNTVQWGTKVPADAEQAVQNADPNTAREPQEAHEHPTAAPSVAPEEDDSILPDRGKPVPESLRRDANHGVLDPAEPGHPLPDGLARKPAPPLNKHTGRRNKDR